MTVAPAAAFSVALWLQLFSFPIAVVSPALDSSWAASLVYFAERGVQFGHDVIFSYGPLGYLVSESYIGTKISSARIVWTFAAPTMLTIVAVTAIAHLSWRWRIATALYMLLFFRADLSIDSFYFFAAFAIALLLLRYGIHTPTTNTAGALFGVISLIKVSYLLASVSALLPVLLFYGARRAAAAAGILLASFATGFLLAWGLTGQALANLPAFLAAWSQVASGYKEAMGLPVANLWVLITGGVCLAVAIALCTSLVLRRRASHGLAAGVLLAAATYLAWNRGFIRADDHVTHFFSVVPPLASLAVTLENQQRRKSLAQQIALALLFATGVAGVCAQHNSNVTRSVAEFAGRSFRATYALLRLPAIEPSLQTQFAEQTQRLALPRVKQEVGSARVDVFGYEQGIAIINALNYTPRFAFQSYSAYTQDLSAANAAFYASPAAPEYVLMKVQTIDDRYPAGDDSLALLEVMKRYEPLFEEGGYWLWRRSNLSRAFALRKMARPQIHFGDELDLPDSAPVLLDFRFRKSITGRFFNLLYKPPVMSLRIRGAAGDVHRYRLIPSMATSALIVSPEMRDAADLVNLERGFDGRRTKSIAVEVDPRQRWFYRSRVSCRISVLSRLPRTSAAPP